MLLTDDSEMLTTDTLISIRRLVKFSQAHASDLKKSGNLNTIIQAADELSELIVKLKG